MYCIKNLGMNVWKTLAPARVVTITSFNHPYHVPVVNKRSYIPPNNVYLQNSNPFLAKLQDTPNIPTHPIPHPVDTLVYTYVLVPMYTQAYICVL